MNKRFTSLLTTLLLSVFLAVTASAYDVEVDGICYNYIAGGKAVEVTYGFGYFDDVTIPETITVDDVVYNVTSVGEGAFGGCTSLTSITIPNSVTSIGSSAFSGCTSLTSITIPNSVTSIGEYAFCDCTDLTSISISNSVTSIGDYAFYDCTDLTSISISNSVTSIGEYAFKGCISLASITIPKSLTSIGDRTFSDCTGLTSITIPNSVTSIGNEAFCGCTGLTSITIPNSVTSIGSSAFSGCNGLTSITIPSSVTSIGDRTFSDCTGLTSITIPSSVTSIGDGVFGGCNGLASITIPNSVTSIGEGAFGGCTSLTSITIPNSVTSIGSSAFWHCTSLTSITIPSSMTSIGDYAFCDCTGLTSITIPQSVRIGYGIFKNCNNISHTIIINNIFVYFPKTYNGHYSIPDNITRIGDGAFENCTKLTSITIPNSIRSIGERPFSGCSSLSTIKLPNTMSIIDAEAFYNCTGLTSITIPNSVTSIGYRSFYQCYSLKSVTIPSSITTIGDDAFGRCNIEKLSLDCSITNSIEPYHIKELTIGDNLTIVYDYFKKAPLTKIVLGKNVTQIRTEAFTSSQLEELTITGEEPPYLYPNVFGTQDLSNATLYVPESKTEYYQTTEPWSKFGKVLTLSGETPEEPKKCETPTISYSDGKLQFSCETEGAKCYYTLNCQDVKSGETKVEDNAVTLSACYDITCYAKAEGYVISDVATAKLYWLTSSGTLETDNINAAKTRGVVIQSADGFVTISGLDSNEQVDFFATDGKALGSAKAMGGIATFAAQSGSVVVAKIGKESVKIAVK